MSIQLFYVHISCNWLKLVGITRHVCWKTAWVLRQRRLGKELRGNTMKWESHQGALFYIKTHISFLYWYPSRHGTVDFLIIIFDATLHNIMIIPTSATTATSNGGTNSSGRTLTHGPHPHETRTRALGCGYHPRVCLRNLIIASYTMATIFPINNTKTQHNFIEMHQGYMKTKNRHDLPRGQRGKLWGQGWAFTPIDRTFLKLYYIMLQWLFYSRCDKTSCGTLLSR